jgi:hypothetical protein
VPAASRRNNLHTFEAGICHQFIRISQHLLINFHIFHNRLNKSHSLHTNTNRRQRNKRQIEIVPLPPEEKKERGTDDMTPALSLTEFTSLTFSNLRGRVVFTSLRTFCVNSKRF